jgi:hypothetical protein
MLLSEMQDMQLTVDEIRELAVEELTGMVSALGAVCARIAPAEKHALNQAILQETINKAQGSLADLLFEMQSAKIRDKRPPKENLSKENRMVRRISINFNVDDAGTITPKVPGYRPSVVELNAIRYLTNHVDYDWHYGAVAGVVEAHNGSVRCNV